VSVATTQGLRIEVRSEYRPDRSAPAGQRYLFTYTVRLTNQGTEPARLVSRHWIITDAHGSQEEVRGEGVVGQQPRLAAGETFEYSSFCILRTPFGAMRGTYQMVRDDGAGFDATIAPFSLAVPGSVN